MSRPLLIDTNNTNLAFWKKRFLTKLQIEVFLTIFSLVSLLYHQGLKRSGY
ncbi:MAG: hypothetical protein ABUJ92_15030 [Desulfobacterales bacterium]